MARRVGTDGLPIAAPLPARPWLEALRQHRPAPRTGRAAARRPTAPAAARLSERPGERSPANRELSESPQRRLPAVSRTDAARPRGSPSPPRRRRDRIPERPRRPLERPPARRPPGLATGWPPAPMPRTRPGPAASDRPGEPGRAARLAAETAMAFVSKGRATSPYRVAALAPPSSGGISDSAVSTAKAAARSPDSRTMRWPERSPARPSRSRKQRRRLPPKFEVGPEQPHVEDRQDECGRGQQDAAVSRGL